MSADDRPGDRVPVLLATGTYDSDAHPRVRVLVEGMRALGWRVDEVVEPLRLPTSERVRILEHAAALPRLAAAIGRAWWRLVPRLRRRMRTGARPDAVLVGHLGHFDVGLIRALCRPAPVVLDYLVSGTGTAVDRRVGGSIKTRLLAALDRFALGRADVVLVDTDEHLAELPPAVRPWAVVVPVGADERWFAAGRTTNEERRDGPLSVVFYGLFTPLQGTTTIAEALRLLDGAVEVTIVGGGQDEAAVDRLLRGVPGVRRLPWVPADELPALVARHDVCLGIFGTTDKALRVVPTKVFQGAAAGCAVVTGDAAPQRRALGDDAVFVPVGDAAALAAALRGLAADDERLARLRRAARTLAEASFMPEQVVRDLDARLRPARVATAP